MLNKKNIILYYKQHKMNENPYVYSGNVGQKSEAQAWQSENKPVGYTEQQIYDARQEHEQQRARDCAAAMNEMKGGKQRRNKKSKRIVRRVNAKSHKNRKSRAKRHRM
jgi:hypothetical protein